MSGNDFQTLHQHSILVCADLQRFLLCTRPSEVPIFNPLIQQHLFEFLDKYCYTKDWMFYLEDTVGQGTVPRKNLSPGNNSTGSCQVLKSNSQRHLHQMGIEYSGWFYISCPVIWKSLFRSAFVHTEL